MLTLTDIWRGPDRYEPLSPWGPISAICIVALAILLQIVVVPLVVFGAFAAGYSDQDVNAAFDRGLNLASPIGLAQMVAAQVLSLAIIWLAAGRAGQRAAVLRLEAPQPTLLAAIAAGLVLIAVTSPIELLIYRALGIDIFADAKWLVEGLRSPFWWGVVLVAVVLAPLWEEFAFRGFLLSALSKTRLGYWPSAVLLNVGWTALHSHSKAGLASVFMAGLFLSWLMKRTGALKTVVIAHAVANTAALLFAYYFAPVS